MLHYYVLAKEDAIDDIFQDLSSLPSSMLTSIIVRDNSGIMPSRYIRVSTEVLTDAGVVDTIKKNTQVFRHNIKMLKTLEAKVVLV